jgi:protein involved in polysaccharide export with SLBB domain
MKIPKMVVRGTKIVIGILCCLTGSIALGTSETKDQAGFYVVVTYVPADYKEKIDGFHTASKEGKISFPFMNVEIAADKDINEVREDLTKAIARHHYLKFPNRSVFPGVNIISDSDVKRVSGGLSVMGQTRRPGTVQVSDGLTVFQAIQATGGCTEWGSMRKVAVFRSKKLIYCDFTKAESFKILSNPGDIVIVPLKNFVPEGGYP